MDEGSLEVPGIRRIDVLGVMRDAKGPRLSPGREDPESEGVLEIRVWGIARCGRSPVIRIVEFTRVRDTGLEDAQDPLPPGDDGSDGEAVFEPEAKMSGAGSCRVTKAQAGVPGGRTAGREDPGWAGVFLGGLE